MFPVISTLDEFRQAKAILIEEKEKLQSEDVDVSGEIEAG
jgi:phosphotransferase system enzyme I (PtsI)